MKKLDYYYDESVGFTARRLAFCFNLASIRADSQKPRLVIDEGIQLYQASTGNTDLPSLSKDEEIYMRLAFTKMAARMLAGKRLGWASPVEEIGKHVEEIEAAAKEKGLKFNS